MSLVAANREVYELLKDGIPVSVPDREHGGQKSRAGARDRLGEPERERLPARQPVERHRRALHLPAGSGRLRQRPAAGRDRAEEARRAGASRRSTRTSRSYKHPQNGIPQLFWYNALLIASNGTESRVGSLTADWERFFEWKRIEREDEPRRVSLEVMLRGTCEPDAPARPRGELHALLRAQGGPGQDPRPEPPVPRRQQRHRRDARGARRWARARRRVLADAGRGQELLDGVLRAEDPAQVAGQLDLRGRHRPRRAGRPDRQDLQGDRARSARPRATSATPGAARTCASCCAATTATSSR